MHINPIQSNINNMYSGEYNPSFKSILYNPKSIVHRMNPVVRFMDDYFQRSLYVSRRTWHNKDNALKPYITEVHQPIAKTDKTVTLWDINKDDRQQYLIIMHGLSQNITSLQPLYKEILCKTNFAVLAAEYRGYEHENKDFVYHSPKKISQDANAALDYLNGKGIENKDVIVLGHSFGGYAASRLARKHNDLGGMILASPTDTYRHRINSIVCGAKKNVPAGVRNLFMKSRILRFPLNIIFNTHRNLKKTSVPVDIIHSKSDKLISFETSQNLAYSVKNLNSFNIINGTHKMDENKMKMIVDLLNLK